MPQLYNGMVCAKAKGMVSIKTAFRSGVDGSIAEVQGVKTQALCCLVITGLVGDIVRESRERVLGCLATLGFDGIPSGRIVVHLSPADEKKQGSHFDLAIALVVLALEQRLSPHSLRNLSALGELALDGTIRRVAGATLLLDSLIRAGSTDILVSEGNRKEAALFDATNIRLAKTLSDVIAHLTGGEPLSSSESKSWQYEISSSNPFQDVVGQNLAKRALQIAVAGRHHLLMVGSPGVGKSLLAGAAAGLQPPLSRDEYLETARIHESDGDKRLRSFRNPHHSISSSAFLGGGTGCIIPGEVSLAHRGILFLDEFPEFRRDVVEGLREPLEAGKIHLHRIGKWHCLPAKFTLIAAMNPCPCGYSLEGSNRCRCTDERRLAYSRRVSGPILDRMDMTVIMDSKTTENDSRVWAVHEAVARQQNRFFGMDGVERNGDISWGESWAKLNIPPTAEAFIRKLSKSALSLRVIHKVLRVSRTIADLEGSECVKEEHIFEAWELRCLPSLNFLTGLFAT